MKWIIEVDSADDVDTAIAQLLAQRVAFEPEEPSAPEEPAAAPAPAKRTRKPKTTKTPKTAPTNGLSEPVSDPSPALAPASKPRGIVMEGAENAREQLRTVAINRGVLWVRGVLDQCGAKRLSELTDEQVWETLRDVAA